MAAAKGAVYAAPSPDFPPVVVVLMDGKIIGCQPVLSIKDGESVLAEMIDSLTAMATKEEGAQ